MEGSFGSMGRLNTSDPEFLQEFLDGRRKLLRESVQTDSKLLFNHLLKQKSAWVASRGSRNTEQGTNMENINKILMKLHGAGFFENTELANLQMFLEWADLTWLPNKVQTQLYRSLMLFLNESKYSLLIKYGVCMQALRLVDQQPSSLRVSGLYEYPIQFMFDKCATLGLYEMVILYTKGQVLKLLPQEETGFLEDRILEEFERLRSAKLNPFHSCPFTLWLELASYVAVQRYRELEGSTNGSRFCEFNPSQTRLLQDLVAWLSSSRDWTTRIDLRK